MKVIFKDDAYNSVKNRAWYPPACEDKDEHIDASHVFYETWILSLRKEERRMSDKNELHTATVDVIVPFEFCKHCNSLELEDYPGCLWANGEPVAHEYSCKHGYFCRNIIELYERSVEE